MKSSGLSKSDPPECDLDRIREDPDFGSYYMVRALCDETQRLREELRAMKEAGERKGNRELQFAVAPESYDTGAMAITLHETLVYREGGTPNWAALSPERKSAYVSEAGNMIQRYMVRRDERLSTPPAPARSEKP